MRRLLALLALALLDNGCVNLGGYTFTPAQDGIIYAGLEDGLDYSLVQIDLASGNPSWTVQLVDGGNLK